MSRILVIGATGRLGRWVVAGLQSRGLELCAFTRDASAAQRVLGPDVPLALGDLGAPATIEAALRGVSRVFLLSPISETLATQQIALIQAAQAARVEGLVKLSGSSWTLSPPGTSLSGDAHRQVDAALARSGLRGVSLQPNAWMQVALGRLADDLRQGRIDSRFPDAPVSYIDARDIADVAVELLARAELPEGPLVLTGGEALTHRDIAAWAETRVHHPVVVRDLGALPPAEPSSFTEAAHAQFATLIRRGVAAEVTTTVSSLLGRAPRTVAAFLNEQLAH